MLTALLHNACLYYDREELGEGSLNQGLKITGPTNQPINDSRNSTIKLIRLQEATVVLDTAQWRTRRPSLKSYPGRVGKENATYVVHSVCARLYVLRELTVNNIS